MNALRAVRLTATRSGVWSEAQFIDYAFLRKKFRRSPRDEIAGRANGLTRKIDVLNVARFRVAVTGRMAWHLSQESSNSSADS